MSVHVLPDLIQGSDEWLKQRCGMVTASVVGQLITPGTIKPANNDKSRALVTQLVAERITGWVDPTYVNDDMLRGVEDEPRAVAKYAEHFGVEVETVGFMVNDDLGYNIGYSPDGLIGDDGLLEVKSRRPKKHVATILADEVPAENMAQLQCGLLVSGRAWIDYVSYCGGMPMWPKRVEPDERWQKAIVAATTEFELTATELVNTYRSRVKGLPMTERTFEQEMVI